MLLKVARYKHLRGAIDWMGVQGDLCILFTTYPSATAGTQP